VAAYLIHARLPTLCPNGFASRTAWPRVCQSQRYLAYKLFDAAPDAALSWWRSLRDQSGDFFSLSDADLARGDYTLVVYCFGSGRVSIMLRVGTTTGERVLINC